MPLCLLAGAAYSVAGCAVALGPGYTIVSQQITVNFVPTPQPVIRLEGVYQLKNDGNQPLTSLELRLPGRRRFHFSDPSALWDKTAVNFAISPDNPRNVVLAFPQPWTVSSRHTLRLSVEYQRAASNEVALSFTPDAFFLPAQGWAPELLPARGIFATGGVPPKSWNLVVRVPGDFLVHSSGQSSKQPTKNSRDARERTIRIRQTLKDGYPFVIAGRYVAATLTAGQENVNLWTRSPQNPEGLRHPSEALARAIQSYNSTFGARPKDSHQLWLVECPDLAGCFTSTTSNFARLTSEADEKTSAEMASQDTAMVDLTGGTPEIAAAAPSLASSWLGYAQNPGFFEQTPPLSALPAFAASRGREAVEGPQVRAQIIRRLLRVIPVNSPARQPETDDVLRAKSLLFFYGLQDRYGPQVFSAALSHMLDARRGGGFDLDDLIAAFEEETHNNVAEFVRLWMKRPGVPQEFRARYENSAASASPHTLKESTQ
ncbi:MAG: hypothetical protein JWO71_2216 [Candidatus Acidoferrum typicum]|nr:hypothetical protein [Candidatus Acidoferrum typicum]